MTVIAVTGVGLLTACGRSPQEVLTAIETDTRPFRPGNDEERRLGVSEVAELTDFSARKHFPAAGFRRLMSREAELATVATGQALADANIVPDRTVPAEDIDVYMGTGASSLDFRHILRMVAASAGADGLFDEELFSTVGLKRIHPLLSFKILPNMPPCFSSILNRLRGDNLIFNPWEGNGAQAIIEGCCRIRRGGTVVVVGASDVKTHTQAFVFLNQIGAFPMGPPGEGAAYLVLEARERAASRGQRPLAYLHSWATCSDPAAGGRCSTDHALLAALIDKAIVAAGRRPQAVISSQNGRVESDAAEAEAIGSVLGEIPVISPKFHCGDTFAAAAPIALAVAVAKVRHDGCDTVLVNCFGTGRERAVFIVGTADGRRNHAG